MRDKGRAMQYFRVKNYEKFQHYSKRNPPWIRLYVDLLNADDIAYTNLSDAHKLHLIHIWLLASRHQNRIPLDEKWLQRRLNVTEKINLKPLFDAGFLVICGDASTAQASCNTTLPPETETETEEQSTDNPPNPPLGGAAEDSPETDAQPRKTKRARRSLAPPSDLEASIVTEWNRMAESCRVKLPKVRFLGAGHREELAKRLEEPGWPDHWREAMQLVPKLSAWYFGANDRNWRANLEWFLRRNTVARLLEREGNMFGANTEGVYDRKDEPLPV